MALSYDDVLEALQQSGVDAGKTRLVLEKLKSVEEEKKEEAEDGDKEPKKKNQLVVFVMDDGSLTDKQLIGYIVQHPETTSATTVDSLIVNSVRGYNNGSRKARKHPITTIGDAMLTLKGKWLADSKLKIKTKEPVLIIPVRNDIVNFDKQFEVDD